MKGFNIQKMLKQAQKMRDAMTSAQEELATITVEGSAGGGLVAVKFNAKGEFISIKIKPEAINPENPESVSEEDLETLEDLVSSSIKDAITKAAQLSEQKMSTITGGMDINLPPGML